jgi:hypothetical protein
MFKFKAFGETIEVSPFWVVLAPLCRMIEQPAAGSGWTGIPLDRIRTQAVASRYVQRCRFEAALPI